MNAATSSGVTGRLERRVSTIRAHPLSLVRHCIGLLLAAALLLTGFLVVAGQQGDTTSVLQRINSARAGRSAGPVESHPGLDRLAASYLEEVFSSQSFSPSGYGSLDADVLSRDVAAATGDESYRYAGLVVAYGQGLDNATAVALGTTANGPALFEPAMSEIGIASGVVQQSAGPWLAPPPGGVGRQIEMTGMTVMVIVTVGTSRPVSE